MEAAMLGDPVSPIEAGWGSVFHQSTLNLMIGRLTTPTSARMAPAFAPRSGLSKARTRAMWPRYRKNSTSTEVSRASHTHQAPQVGRPHNEPVARQISVKAAPIGAAACAAISASGCRHTSATALASATNRYADKAI